MNCPRCGKEFDIGEKKFCTGCGEPITADMLAPKKDDRRAGQLPFGVRLVASDVEMNARVKGLAVGAFFGLALFFVLAKFTFLSHWGTAIGYGVIGCLIGAPAGVVAASKMSPNAIRRLADSFRFIPTEGPLYMAADFISHLLVEQRGKKSKKSGGKGK